MVVTTPSVCLDGTIAKLRPNCNPLVAAVWALSSGMAFLFFTGRMLFRWSKSAFPVAERGGCGVPATANIDLLPLFEGEPNREVFAPLMTAVTKGEIFRSAATAAKVGSGIKDDSDWHSGVGVHVAHDFSSFWF